MAVNANRSPLALVIFGLALLGVLVVTHLHFQQRADFAFGCTGAEEFDAGAALSGGTADDCAEVTSSRWSSFLGVNNVVWGLLFYGLLALLRGAYGATGDRRLRLASLAVAVAGFLYTLYLVYVQVAEIGAFCLLCMTSAAIVTLLMILHVMEHMRENAEPSPARDLQPRRAAGAGPGLRPYMFVALVFAGLLVADVVVAGGRAAEAEEAAAAAEPAAAPAEPVAAGETPPPTADPGTVQCTYDAALAPIADMERLIDGMPAQGPEDAPVTVVEIFDPNCPHCKTLYSTVHGEFIEAHPQARFYYVPYPLWDFSLGQVAALRLAREEGRFFQLVDELFQRQGGRGMTLDQVVEAAAAAGVNGPNLRRQLTDNTTLDPLLQNILSHRDFVTSAVSVGGMSVPKVVINGRVLAPDPRLGYPAECLDQLITEAAGGGGE